MKEWEKHLHVLTLELHTVLYNKQVIVIYSKVFVITITENKWTMQLSLQLSVVLVAVM